MTKRGRFVGIGTDHYDAESFDDLDHSVADVTAVAERLAAEFDGELLTDSLRDDIQKHLESVEGTMAGGSLMLMWSGHGFVHAGLRLATKDRVTGVGTGSPVTPVTSPVLVWDPTATGD